MVVVVISLSLIFEHPRLPFRVRGERKREAAMAAVSGVGMTLRASKLCSLKPSSSSTPKSRAPPRSLVKMAVSVDDKKKTYTLLKSEEAFNKAKVPPPPQFSSLLLISCFYCVEFDS